MGWLVCFGAGLAVACAQDDGWIAQAPGFTPGTIQVDRGGSVYVASGLNNRSTNAVIKYGPEGREAWRRGFPNLPEVGVAALGMGLDEAGNIYIAGRKQQDSSMSPWSLMKLRADGSQDWLVEGVGGIRRIAVDRLGQVYTAGWGDAVKYGPDGKVAWYLKLPLPPTMGALNVTVDDLGCAYLVGHNGYGCAVTKVDPDGHRLWTSFYPEERVEGNNALAAAVDSDGSVYVTGNTGDDMVIMKFRADGQRLWVDRPKRPPEARYQSGSAIAVDGHGHVFVSGTAAAAEATNQALITIAYDSNGRELWTARYRGAAINDSGAGNRVVLDGKGHLYVSPKCFCGPWLGIQVVKYDLNGKEMWCSTDSGVGSPADLALDQFGTLHVTSLDGATRKIPQLDSSSSTPADFLASTGSDQQLPTATSSNLQHLVSRLPKEPISPVVSATQPRPISAVKWMNQRIENSVFLAELAGETGAVYEIQRSTDLSNWQQLATIVCKDGVLHFIDDEKPRLPQCFYRAVKKP